MKTEGSGSDYFASMTDMMIGILFIFVIMIAFFAFQINTSDSVPRAVHDPVVEENERLKKLIAKLQQPNPLEVYLNKGRGVRDQIVASTIKKLQAKGIDARSVRQGVITISGKGLFGSGRSDLESVSGAKDKVSLIAQTLESQIVCFAVSDEYEVAYDTCNPARIFVEAVFIEGHTDNDPFSSGGQIANNWDLSTKRATAIVQILSENEAINPESLTAAGRGEFAPIASNETVEGKAKNRRIEVVLTPKLDEISKLLNND